MPGRRSALRPVAGAAVTSPEPRLHQAFPARRPIVLTPTLALAVTSIVWVLLLFLLAVRRYENLAPGMEDLYYTENALWNTLHGRFFGQSILNSSYFGMHFSPALLLWLPAYTVWQDSRAVLLMQAVTLGLGAWPIYWLARAELGQSWLAGSAGLVALLTPFCLFAALDAPYPDALVLPFGGLLLLGLQTRRQRVLIAGLIGTLLVREDFGLFVAGAGGYALLGLRRSWLGVGLIALGLGWTALFVGWLIPHWGGGVYSFGNINPRLGHGPIGVLLGVIRDPVLAFQEITRPPRLDYLFWLLAPFGSLPLLAPGRLLPGLPLVFRNMLAAAPNRSSISTHYSAAVIPSLGFAFVGALARLPRRRARQCALATVVAVGLLAAYGLLAGFRSPVLLGRSEAGAYRAALAALPPQAAVAATPRPATYLARRERLWLVPNASRGVAPFLGAHLFTWEPEAVEWVAFDLNDASPEWRAVPSQAEAAMRNAFPDDQFELVDRIASLVILRRR